MSSHPRLDVSNPRFAECMRLSKCWVWFLILGVGLILLGIAAIGAQYVTALTSLLIFGWLLIGGGVVQIVNAVLAGNWRGFVVHLLIGILHLVVGGFMVEHPMRAAVDLTLILALAFFVGGLVRIIVAVVERFPGWVWVLLNGLITTTLGVLIWRHWPEASLWVIGTFVGIDLVFCGWSWVMLALALRAFKPPATAGASV